MAYSEEGLHQQWLFNWAKGAAHKYPELEQMFHIPNGGLRNKTTAKRLKLEGVKAGIPDIFLPAARRGFHGLFIEMKSAKGVLSQAQKERIQYLTGAGYAVCICRSYQEAAQELQDYLKKEGE